MRPLHPVINVADYRSIVVLTGAGVSAASGLRTYREAGGTWNELDVKRLGTAKAYETDALAAWALSGSTRAAVAGAQPNAAHRTLAALEAQLRPDQEFLLVTQNVDGLHRRAGSKRMVELHGSLRKSKCSNRRCPLESFEDDCPHDKVVPRCPLCGSPLRPDIVLVGEEVPALERWTVKRALRYCDLFVAIGTSGVAADYVRGADFAGARTVLLNPEPRDPPNRYFHETHLGPAETLVPELLMARKSLRL